jgi:hypothetical protein
MHTTIEELLEVMFCDGSTLRLYDEGLEFSLVLRRLKPGMAMLVKASSNLTK